MTSPVPPPAALSVVLAGGGTAGHISPLLSIADAVRDTVSDARLLAVGTAAGMETRLVPAAGYELATIDRVPLPRQPSMDLVKLPVRFVVAIRQARRILRDADASVVVGVGGYVCTPMYIAARQLGVPLVIHEANARPGLANRLGARLTRHVAVAFRSTPLPNAQWVGMPMRPAIAGLDRAARRRTARERLGLDPGRTTLVVTGGSSGAASINQAVAGALPALGGTAIQVLHITGRGKRVTPGDATVPGTYRQVEYVDAMEDVYAAADLVVARAGAATVSELCAVGLPSVLVPLPHGNGEQQLNAREVVAAGGALLVNNADFTPGWITEHVLPLLADSGRLEAMSAAAASLGIRNAAQRMAQMVIQAAAGPGGSPSRVESQERI